MIDSVSALGSWMSSMNNLVGADLRWFENCTPRYLIELFQLIFGMFSLWIFIGAKLTGK